MTLEIIIIADTQCIAYLQKTITLLFMKENFDKERIINYWIESSDKDFKTMNDLYETKNYS